MENKKENFKRIAENRVNKILTLYSQLENLSNGSFYEYTEEQIETIFNTLEKALKETKEKLLKDNKKNKNKRFIL